MTTTQPWWDGTTTYSTHWQWQQHDNMANPPSPSYHHIGKSDSLDTTTTVEKRHVTLMLSPSISYINVNDGRTTMTATCHSLLLPLSLSFPRWCWWHDNNNVNNAPPSPQQWQWCMTHCPLSQPHPLAHPLPHWQQQQQQWQWCGVTLTTMSKMQQQQHLVFTLTLTTQCRWCNNDNKGDDDDALPSPSLSLLLSSPSPSLLDVNGVTTTTKVTTMSMLTTMKMHQWKQCRWCNDNNVTTVMRQWRQCDSNNCDDNNTSPSLSLSHPLSPHPPCNNCDNDIMSPPILILAHPLSLWSWQCNHDDNVNTLMQSQQYDDKDHNNNNNNNNTLCSSLCSRSLSSHHS